MTEESTSNDHRAERSVTALLTAITAGDDHASDELLPVVYDELRKLARSRIAALAPGQTLQPTALVHEAYLRLVGGGADELRWEDRGHFFAAAARSMRNILVDQARRKSRVRHGGGRRRETLHDIDADAADETVDHVALDAALSRLEDEDRLKGDVVSLRYFVGLSIDETAAALGVSPATVDRHWRYARAWLRRELESEEP